MLVLRKTHTTMSAIAYTIMPILLCVYMKESYERTSARTLVCNRERVSILVSGPALKQRKREGDKLELPSTSIE